ncbi:hypothetical protein JCM3766R1_002001, partial [Sporobolomyces carnicolor]
DHVDTISSSSSQARAHVEDGGQRRSLTLVRILEILPHVNRHGCAREEEKEGRRPLVTPSELVELIDSLDDATTVIPDVVLYVLNEFRYHDAARSSTSRSNRDHRFEFARGMWNLNRVTTSDDDPSQRPRRVWNDNVMLGLVMAGTVHEAIAPRPPVVRRDDDWGKERSSSSSSRKEGFEMALELSRWVGDEDGLEDVVARIGETISSSTTTLDDGSSSHAVVVRIARRVLGSSSGRSSSEKPRRQSARGGQDDFDVLREVGRDTRRLSLAEFGHRLVETFALLDAAAAVAGAETRRSSSKTTKNRRSAGRDDDEDEEEEEEEEEDEDEEGATRDERIEQITRSIAALEREQADLRRERRDRVGTAPSMREAKSLMDGESGTVLFAVGEEGEAGEEDDEDSGVVHERERETTFTTDGNGRDDEPPRDLLIELGADDETLDPFRVH